MNGWLHEWMTNLSFFEKKNMPECMHIRVIMIKEKEEK